MLRALTLVLLLAAGAESPGPVAPRPEPPPALRFYSLDGDLDLALLSAKLGEAGAELADGPRTTACRQHKSFVAIRAPADLAAKELESLLRKAKVGVEPLFWTSFEGGDPEPPKVPDYGVGLDTRDAVVGTAGELRWFESAGGTSTFWYAKGKLDAEGIEKRYKALFQPFGGANLGAVARQSFDWKITLPPDPKGVRKLEKALAGVDGVAVARIDPAASALHVEVELDGVLVSALAEPASAAAPASSAKPADPPATDADRAPAVRFHTGAILACLHEAGIETR